MQQKWENNKSKVRSAESSFGQKVWSTELNWIELNWIGHSKFVEMHGDALDFYQSALVFYTEHQVNITINVYIDTVSQKLKKVKGVGPQIRLQQWNLLSYCSSVYFLNAYALTFTHEQQWKVNEIWRCAMRNVDQTFCPKLLSAERTFDLLFSHFCCIKS
jgi:hypothetical protein